MCYVVQQFKLFFSSEIIKVHFISSAQHLVFFFFSVQCIMSFRASQGGGGQAVSSETGTPPKAHCARLLSLTRPIFSCFLFSHSSAICCSNGKRALCSQRLRYKAHLIMETVFFLCSTFSFYLVPFDLILILCAFI